MSRSPRPQKKASTAEVVALALTWDGARWPLKALPPKARAFLEGKSSRKSTLTSKSVAKLLAEDQVHEIRICWVPRLRGGDEVLSEPFSVLDGQRLGFQVIRLVRFGDICGVIYRRSLSSGN